MKILITPSLLMRWHQRAHKPLIGMGLALCVLAGVWGLLWAPEDYRMGHAVRMIYVHVPAAWMALQLYAMMAVASVGALIWRQSTLALLPQALAPLGATMTALALVTGALWGKPMWGAWWVWDARLTSMFVLLLIYVGYMVFMRREASLDQPSLASHFLIVVGALNLPLIKWSVTWFHTLHQPATLSGLQKPAIESSMMIPLLVMTLGYMACVFYGGLTQWVRLLLQRKIRAHQRLYAYGPPQDLSQRKVCHG